MNLNGIQGDKSEIDQKVKAQLAEKNAEIKRLNKELLIQSEEINSQKEIIETQLDVAVQKRDEIIFQKKEITSSIIYAQRIQNALLTDEQLFRKHLKEYFILYKPKDIVSGDFYWMHHSDGKTILVAADSTGHGVGGAFMSLMGIVFLNEIVVSMGLSQPKKILESIRYKIINSLEHKGAAETINAGMDVACICIDHDAKELQYAGAFNSAIIIRNGELIELPADKMPIGNHPYLNDNPFTNHTIQLEDDDSIYLYSDGYIDQFGWRNNKKFMKRNFKNLLLEIQNVPMKAQRLLMENSFQNWKGDLDQLDDVLVIGVQV